MKLLALVAALAAIIYHAHGSLGETESQCNERYGERYSEGDDIYNAQNVVGNYRNSKFGVSVVFNRKNVAIQLTYMATTMAAAEIEGFLKLNGSVWAKPKPKLGSAMEVKKSDVWETPDGKRAELEKTPEGMMLKVMSAERLEQITAKTPGKTATR